MQQKSLAVSGFEKYRKQTRKEIFLEEMNQLIPWQALTAVIEPHYPNPRGAGRRPVGLERMLRIDFLQHWFALSDPATEAALYDTPAMRCFAQIDLGQERMPDATTRCQCRHLLEENNLGVALFDAVAVYLEENGMKVSKGTIVDATIINAPTATKNKSNTRDPDRHQTKQGKPWYFGMKAHIGVDSKTKLIHSVVATPANVHDSQVLGDLLHGEETRLWGDSAYAGQQSVLKDNDPKAKDYTQVKGSRHRKLTEQDKAKNRHKSKVRAKVEHVFHIMQRQYGFTKVRFKGPGKNADHLFAHCALINLMLSKKQLLRLSVA